MHDMQIKILRSDTMINPIRKIRMEKKLTSAELGILSGLHQSRIIHYELGYAKSLSPSLLAAVEYLGYDAQVVSQDYRKWLEYHRSEVLKKLAPRQKKKA
jgi:transcriptional regulator with XRE-family HTH domain